MRQSKPARAIGAGMRTGVLEVPAGAFRLIGRSGVPGPSKGCFSARMPMYPAPCPSHGPPGTICPRPSASRRARPSLPFLSRPARLRAYIRPRQLPDAAPSPSLPSSRARGLVPGVSPSDEHVAAVARRSVSPRRLPFWAVPPACRSVWLPQLSSGTVSRPSLMQFTSSHTAISRH